MTILKKEGLRLLKYNRSPIIACLDIQTQKTHCGNSLVPMERSVMIPAVGDHKERHAFTQTTTHKAKTTGNSALQAYKGTQGSSVAPAPVIVFTSTPVREDGGPVVGVK